MINKIRGVIDSFKLYQLKRKLEPSSTQGLNGCNQCGYCCYYSQCVATPEEFIKIARFLEISPLELLKTKYTIEIYADYYQGELYAQFYFVRHLTKEWSRASKGGKKLLASDRFDASGCIFLDENNHCIIHPVKPLEAQYMRCWEQQTILCKPILEWKNNIFLTDYLKKLK